MTLRDNGGPPLLLVAVRFFFRREVESDHQLFQGLAWANLEALREQHDAAFAALVDHAEAIKRLLWDMDQMMAVTHGAVLEPAA